MKKFVLVPDSFKGTMTSLEVCREMEAAIRAVYPAAQVRALPVADGGEGSVDAFLTALGGERVEVPCTGPDGQPVLGFYGLLPGGTAVLEMAAAAGLPLTKQKAPERTTTQGVGELLLHAARRNTSCVWVAAPPTTAAAARQVPAACGFMVLRERPFSPRAGH